MVRSELGVPVKRYWVIETCNVVNMDIFPWIKEFYVEIDAFDGKKPHAIAEYELIFLELKALLL